jgi:hypothetical protein
MTQYHFLDESGDPPPGLASHFALAMVQLPEHKALSELAAARRTLHLVETFEFKYHKTSFAQKDVFFQAIRPLDFRVRAVVVNKAQLTAPWTHFRGMNFAIEVTAQLVVRVSALDIADDVLVMDGATLALRRGLRIRLSELCRTTRRTRPFAKIISAESDRDDNLQLADMLIGAVRQYALDADTQYNQSFAKKVTDLWLLSASK